MAPILAAVAAFAFSTGGFLSALLAFLLFALTLAALMLLVTTLAASWRPVLLRRLRASSGTIQRAASLVLLAIGVGMIYFTVDVQAFRSLFLR